DLMQVMEKKAFISCTFFPNSLEIVAALKTLEILEREGVPGKLWERGSRFLEKVRGIVADSGVAGSVSGISAMPVLTFEWTDSIYKERWTRFYTECIRRGLFVQPYHHWYINYRHTEEDLTGALEIIRASLSAAWQIGSQPGVSV